MSVNSGYGGNVLLGKKCFALRIASYLGRQQGWMAEHMLILGVENPPGRGALPGRRLPLRLRQDQPGHAHPPGALPQGRLEGLVRGRRHRLAAHRPRRPPVGHEPGVRLLRRGPRHQRQVQPQRPGHHPTGHHLHQCGSQPGRQHRVVGGPGQEPAGARGGLEGPPLERQDLFEKGAHPNSRFTAPAKNCPCISPEFESPQGVPISAIVFGGRRARTAPLVYQSRDWTHGVFVGSIMASEPPPPPTGAVGVVRRDPMAMLPFCGYHMGDYWQHWLDMGEKLGTRPPRIFNVNWFRTDDEGNFLWPGFGDNLRVLEWILKRCFGEADAVETPIGYEPRPEDIDLEDSGVELDTLKGLLGVDKALWQDEVKGIREFYQKFGDKLPKQLSQELDALEGRLI